MNQAVLKKHVGAIQISGRLTLLQRKVFNVLLLNAYPKLPEQDEFSITTRELADMAGFDSNNTERLKQSFRALARTTVEWNILEGSNDEQWTTSALLADATVIKNKGVCNYSYSNRLKEKLYHPEIYAQINLKIQRQFKSAHALVLYENCARFRNVKTTGWFSLDEWRKLFGIADHQYAEFKAFSRRVLKTAINEVNDQSDIEVTPQYRTHQNRVVAIKFAIQGQSSRARPIKDPSLKIKKGQGSERAHSQSLYDRLIQFGLTSRDAQTLLTHQAPSRIEQNLNYVNRRIKTGHTIRYPVAYLKKAILNDYGKDEVSNQTNTRGQGAFTPVRPQKSDPQTAYQHVESLYRARCLEAIQHYLNHCTDTEQATLADEFEKTLDDPQDSQLFNKRSWSSPLLFSKIIAFWQAHPKLSLPTLTSIAKAQGVTLPPIQ